ncbi:MAG: hypothetical protein ACRD0Z_01925 [Acidimicrobiales bacterium]
MSSLWTPGGEHRVPRATDPSVASGGDEPPTGSGSPPGPADSGGGGMVDDEMDEATAAELQELTRQLASAPPEDVVANHCYGLFELAALHLAQQPANLEAARLSIDAMALVVDGLGDRLGQHHTSLADGLSQLRLAYVRIVDAAAPGAAD